MLANAFNPCTWEVEATGSSELKSSMLFLYMEFQDSQGYKERPFSPNISKYYTVWKSEAMLSKDYPPEILKIDIWYKK